MTFEEYFNQYRGYWTLKGETNIRNHFERTWNTAQKAGKQTYIELDKAKKKIKKHGQTMWKITQKLSTANEQISFYRKNWEPRGYCETGDIIMESEVTPESSESIASLIGSGQLSVDWSIGHEFFGNGCVRNYRISDNTTISVMDINGKIIK